MSIQFKKKKRSSKLRSADDASSEEDVTVIEKELKKPKVNMLMTSKSKAADISMNVKSEMKPERFEAAGGITTTIDYDDKEHDKIAQLRDQIRLQKEADEEGADFDPKIYRGNVGYKQYIQKTEAQISANKFTGSQGPIRATSHIAISNRFDYQPEICKDYKETGYCSFGDSCKFIHDRGDYKSGWEIDRDWEKEQEEKRKRKENGESSEDEDNKYVIESSDEEELPFACFICREEFTKPVVTTCGHYFCEKCAMDNYRKTSKCAVCGKNTNGCFNKATEIIERLKKKHAEDVIPSESESDHEEPSSDM